MHYAKIFKSPVRNKSRRFLLQALGFACLTAAALPAARAQTTYTWHGGIGTWETGGFWDPTMTVPDSANADVFIDGGKTGTASVVAMNASHTVGRLTVDAGDTLNINDNQALTVTAGSFAGSGSVIDNGTINVASGGNNGTALVFTTTGSLSGTGTLNLMNNAFVYANGGSLLTIGTGFTVAGSGQLGNGSTTFTNNGTVNANVSGSVLNVRPGGGTATFTNNGLAEATGGGILQLDGQNASTFSGGTFQALAGSTVNLVNGVTVSGATLTTAGTGVVNAFNGTTLTNVTSGGKLNVVDNSNATLKGTFTFTNNSTTTIASGGNNGTGLLLNGPVSLAGTGTLQMTNNAFLQATNSGDRLTIGAGITIQGQGQVGVGSTTFTNNGTVNANVNGQVLELRPGGTAATGADFTNVGAGFAEATNGGTLNLNGANAGTFVKGTFEALAGSTINIFNTATVSNAILTTAGTTGVVNVGGNTTLANVTNGGTLNVPDNNNAYLLGTYTNNGTTTIASGGNNGTGLLLSGPVTLAGTGTVQMNNTAFLYAVNSGDRLTIGAGTTVQGQGQLGQGSTTFTNNGLVNANIGGGTINLRPGGSTADFTNVGTGFAEATNGGSLNLDGQNTGTFTGNSFRALAGSILNIFNSATVSNATLTTVGSGVVNLSLNPTLNNVTSNAAVFLLDNNNASLAGTYTFANGSVTTINSGGNNGTNLLLSGPVILAGTGTVQMNNNASLYAVNGGDRLTIGTGITIQGQGQVGLGRTTFVNNGLINANIGGGTINLRPSAGTGAFTNNTIAEATNGGSLNLDGQNAGTFVGGTFLALAGSTLNIFNSATVSSATLTTVGSGVVNLSGNPTLNNVTSNAAVFVVDNNNAFLSGTYTFANGSTTTVNSGGNNGTGLLLTGPVTLAGTGTVQMNNNAFLYAVNGGDRLTIGAGITIQGQGQLGFGSTTFINNGLINANIGGGTINLRPSAGTGAFTNNTIAEATNGGSLNLDGQNAGTFVGGTFRALAGSTLNIFNSATVSSATLTTVGSGVVNLSGNPTLNNVTSNAAVFVVDNNNASLAGTYTFANGSTTTVNSGGNNGTNLLLSGPVILAGTGTVQMNNNAFVYATNGGDLLTIGAGVTIQGQGQLGFGSTTFSNSGTVNANFTGATLDVRPSAGTVGFTNAATGLVEATGGGTLRLDGSNGNFTNNGTFAAISGSTGGGSNFSVDAGHLTNFAGTALTGGTYKVISTNPAATSTLSFGGGTITTNAANVVLSGASTVFTEIGGLANNQGSFAVANGRNFTTAGALANSGTLVAAGGSTLTVAGPLTQTSAGTLTGDGTFTAASFALSGNINPGGTVSPTTGVFADAAGLTTLNGNASFDVSTLFHFELGSTVTGPNDRLTVNGLLSLSGKLNVTALTGFGNGTYDLIDYPIANAAYLLAHYSLTLGTLPAGYTYTLINTIPGQVDLVVLQNVPEPEAWVFVLGGGALLMGVQRARRSAQRNV